MSEGNNSSAGGFYRTLFDNAVVGMYRTKIDGSAFLEVNRKFAEIIGFTPEELIGAPDHILWADPDDRDRMLLTLKDQGGALNDYEARIVAKNGDIKTVLASITLHPDEGCLDGTMIDITERKRAEEALKRHARELAVRNRIAQIFLTVSDEEMYTEVLEVILDVMGSRFGVFGYLDERGDFVVPTMTRTIWDKCQVPDKRFVFPHATWGCSSWPTAIREKRTIFYNEPSTLTPPGHIQITRHISMPLVHQGGVVGLIQVANKEQDYTAEDVSLLEAIGRLIAPVLQARLAKEREEEKLKKALGDLARSNRELEQFAYVASHDLQEPLRMVSSYTQLLARRYGDRLDQDAKEFIAYAVDGANRMQRLINDLLQYSRLSTRGKTFEETDTHAALGEAIANLQTAIGESGALVTNDDLPAVRADAGQLVQLFQNLIGNAVRFHRPDQPPLVHVSARREGLEWVFSVKDNGIGIDPQYFDRIFVIFQRLHTKNEYDGTGIGLALCKRIVERHGGRIWVESAPGEGATFFFSITDTERGVQ